jgi:hypothetical protein
MNFENSNKCASCCFLSRFHRDLDHSSATTLYRSRYSQLNQIMRVNAPIDQFKLFFRLTGVS